MHSLFGEAAEREKAEAICCQKGGGKKSEKKLDLSWGHKEDEYAEEGHRKEEKERKEDEENWRVKTDR